MSERRPFPESLPYRTEIRAILGLHRLWQEGKGESPEAEAVRDATDGSWELLSETERKRIRGLSEDLNSLSEPNANEPAQPMNPQSQAKLVEVTEARDHGHWDRALELLRRWGNFVAPALRSYLRASIWFQAGDPAAALEFIEHSKRIEPTNEIYWGAWLSALQKTDKQKALVHAEEVLRDANSRPISLVIFAAQVVWESAASVSGTEAIPIYRHLISTLSTSLPRIESAQFASISTTMLAYAMLAACHKDVGEPDKSLHYLSRGLAVDPFNANFLIDRGILLYGNAHSAIEDFELAIKLGTPNTVPYLFLAHHLVTTGRLNDCRLICESGIQKAGPEFITSYLLTWLAISLDGLGRSPDEVRATFERAIRVDPSNNYARKNLAAFEKALSNPVQKGDWDNPSPSLLRNLGRQESRQNNFFSTQRELAAV